MKTELENETKFLLSIGKKRSEVVSHILWDTETISIGDHLMVYYDDGEDAFLNGGHTFRLTLRQVDGINKHRATFKLHQSSTASVRTCMEYHFPMMSPFKQDFHGNEMPLELKQLLINQGFYAYLQKSCWLRVKRHRIILKGVHCELDFCKTNKGAYFEELETEEPITEEWINFLRTRYGISWLSNTNKYKRTRLLNEM